MNCVPQARGELAPQDDSSSSDVPPIFSRKAPQYWKWIGIGALAVILIALTTAVIYLYLQDASTDNEIKYKDEVMKEMKEELGRYAEAIHEQSDREDAAAAKLETLTNESNALKQQVDAMVIQKAALNRRISYLVNETDALKLLVAFVLVKENVTAQRTATILEQSELLQMQLSDVVRRIESALEKGNEMASRPTASSEQGAGVRSTAVRHGPRLIFLSLQLACYAALHF